MASRLRQLLDAVGKTLRSPQRHGWRAIMATKGTAVDEATLLRRQRELENQDESLLPSKRRDELRLEIARLQKLLEQLGYRRLD